MRLAQSTILVAAALVAAGCGDSDGGDGGEPGGRQASPAATTETAPAAPAPRERREQAGSRAAEPKRKRLEEAGYDVTDSGVEGVRPAPEAALEFPLKGGGGMTVFAYRSAADARKKAAEFEPLARRYPDFFRVAVEGPTAYVGVAEEPERIDAEAFDAAVARAEGR